MRQKHPAAFLHPKCVSELLESHAAFNEPENDRAYWFGTILSFNGSQKLLWQVLWNNFVRGNLPIPQQRVLSVWHGDSAHVSDLFKRHPAWKNVIVGDGRGNLWLRIPDEVLARHPVCHAQKH
jgi:hypothetical protein